MRVRGSGGYSGKKISFYLQSCPLLRKFLKSCSIHHWKFPEAQTNFFNEWKVPTKCKTQKSGNLLHRTLFNLAIYYIQQV